MHRRIGFILLAALALAACGVDESATGSPEVYGGDPKRGGEAIAAYGCPACHHIPGIPAARGIVGPPLSGFGQRIYIAGFIPNQPDNLTRWIMDAPSLSPATAMPNMRVPLAEARDMAAYLYQLR